MQHDGRVDRLRDISLHHRRGRGGGIEIGDQIGERRVVERCRSRDGDGVGGRPEHDRERGIVGEPAAGRAAGRKVWNQPSAEHRGGRRLCRPQHGEPPRRSRDREAGRHVHGIAAGNVAHDPADAGESDVEVADQVVE